MFWNDEPAPFNVPLADAALEAAGDDAAAEDAGVDVLDDEVDEEHAARAIAATTAPRLPQLACCLGAALILLVMEAHPHGITF